MSSKMKIKKGDTVIVIAGKDRGKQGAVLSAFPKEKKILVQAANIVKRHTKPSMSSAGGIVEKEMPLDISNVALVDPKTGKPTKVGFKILEDGQKVRFARASGEILDV